MAGKGNDASYFDVGFCIPSSTCTAALNVVYTTGGFYYGLNMHVVSGYAEVFVFDNASDTTGKILGIECASAAVAQAPHLDVARYEHYTPVRFDKGITVKIIGTAIAIMFYGPKG